MNMARCRSEYGATLVEYAIGGAVFLFLLLTGINQLRSQIISLDANLAVDAGVTYPGRISVP